jgi:hypothetical protein
LHEEVSKHLQEYDVAKAVASQASDRVQSIRLAADEWQREGERLRSQGRGVYVDPTAARDAILTHLRSRGLERTVAVLREQPEAFGALHAVERKAALGLITVRDTTQAERSAHYLVDDVKRLHESATRLRDRLGISESVTRPAIDRAVQHAEAAYQQARTSLEELKQLGQRLPSLATVERAILDVAQALEPRELRTLRRFLTDPSALLVAHLRGVALEIALGRERSIER